MTTHASTEHAALEASGIRKRYRRRLALNGVSLTAAAGEVVAVVGENGSGKTTLMRICAGALRAARRRRQRPRYGARRLLPPATGAA